jgi:hypothetical protein
MKLIRTGLFCCGLALCRATYGEVITFDDLQGGGVFAPGVVIPNGYQGLNWTELFVLNTTKAPASGYVGGTISPNNVALIPDFTPVEVGTQYSSPATITSTTPFIFDSGYFTAAWLNGETLEVIGKNGSATEFDQKFTINATNTSFLTFPDLALTEVDFITSGGDEFNRPFGGSGEQVAMDNLTIDFVPDAASTAWLLAASVGGLAVLRKRFS